MTMFLIIHMLQILMVGSDDESHIPHAVNLCELRDKEAFMVSSVDGSHFHMLQIWMNKEIKKHPS